MASNNLLSNYSISNQCKQVPTGVPGPQGPPNTFIFNVPGSYTITVPSNSQYVSVSMVGGGSDGSTRTGGGSSGASVVDYLLSLGSNTTVSVAVGAGGTLNRPYGGDSSITIGGMSYTAGGGTTTNGGALKNFMGGFPGTTAIGPNGAPSFFARGGTSEHHNGFMGSSGYAKYPGGNGGNGYVKLVFLPASNVNSSYFINA
jgi:hypothetical protein